MLEVVLASRQDIGEGLLRTVRPCATGRVKIELQAKLRCLGGVPAFALGIESHVRRRISTSGPRRDKTVSNTHVTPNRLSVGGLAANSPEFRSILLRRVL